MALLCSLLNSAVFIILVLISYISCQTPREFHVENVHHLTVGIRDHFCAGHHEQLLHIYCYSGRPKSLIQFFETAALHVNINPDKYERYDGSTPDEVVSEYEKHRSSWSITPQTWKRTDIKLHPFNQSCVGIDTKECHEVYVNVLRVDYWKVLLLVSGLLLFVFAPTLSDSALFYYVSGVSVGVCASFLILVYIFSRLLPKRPVVYGFVLGSWAVGVYLLQLLWDNLRTVLGQYQSAMLWYVGLSSVLSFAVCYRLGPPSDPRSKHLIRWTLQAAALAMVYHSSWHQEAAVAVIVAVLLMHNFPQRLKISLATCWRRQFPPRVRLLSEEEYHEQGVLETAKGLEQLRKFCSSPDCNTWRTVTRIHDPVRFAEFMNGKSHIDDAEILAYEAEPVRTTELYTDDDSD